MVYSVTAVCLRTSSQHLSWQTVKPTVTVITLLSQQTPLMEIHPGEILYLQHKIKQLQPVAVSLHVLHYVEIQDAQRLGLYVHALPVL